jgi:Ca2+-binding EF-hand superfamily protein
LLYSKSDFIVFLVKPSQINHLYKRFTQLDRDNSGSLSADELLCIPEFAMNPLAHRFLDILQQEQAIGSNSKPLLSYSNEGNGNSNGFPLSYSPLYKSIWNQEIDFKTFLRFLSVFSTDAREQDKLVCK